MPESNPVGTWVPDATPQITLSPAALVHVQKQIKARGKGVGMRLGIKKMGCSGYGYEVALIDETAADDHTYTIAQDLVVAVNPKSFPYVRGTYIDYVKEGLNYKFIFHNPNAESSCGCGESFGVKD